MEEVEVPVDLLVRASRQAVKRARRTEWYIDQEEAEQEAMIGAWQAIGKSSQQPTFMYCLQGARWAVRDYVRRTRGQEVVDGIVYQRKEDMRYGSEWALIETDESALCSLGLESREEQIVRLRVEGYTLAEIGAVLGVGEARVCQILKNTKEKVCQN